MVFFVAQVFVLVGLRQSGARHKSMGHDNKYHVRRVRNTLHLVGRICHGLFGYEKSKRYFNYILRNHILLSKKYLSLLLNTERIRLLTSHATLSYSLLAHTGISQHASQIISSLDYILTERERADIIIYL